MSDAQPAEAPETAEEVDELVTHSYVAPASLGASVQLADADGEPFVLLRMESVVGSAVYLLPAQMAESIAAMLLTAARQAHDAHDADGHTHAEDGGAVSDGSGGE